MVNKLKDTYDLVYWVLTLTVVNTILIIGVAVMVSVKS